MDRRVNLTIEILRKEGKLEFPCVKKLNNKLYEVRLDFKGNWRIIYSYVNKNIIIILTVFQKKSQKTPRKEIDRAIKIMEDYFNEKENK